MPTLTTAATPTKFASFAPERDRPRTAFTFASVWRAYLACRRGKRRSRSTQGYELQLLDRLVGLQQSLQAHRWQPSPATAFVVDRPKLREVLAAAYGDRIVHHWLVPHLERLFEPVFVFGLWSNRKGKGIHAAVAHLQRQMRSLTENGRQPGYFLQLDVTNFFNRIDRRLLLAMIAERLQKDQRRAADDPRHLDSGLAGDLLWLTGVLLHDNAALAQHCISGRQHHRVPSHKRLVNAPDGLGLPIGNLTSQFFANVYLNALDQFVKHVLKCKHYARYVDDFVLLAADAETLRDWHRQIGEFLHQKLALTLRADAVLAPVAHGADFLGYRVRSSHVLVRPRALQHFAQALDRMEHASVRSRSPRTEQVSGEQFTVSTRCGGGGLDAVQALVASYAGHLKHARSARAWHHVSAHRRWWSALFQFDPATRGPRPVGSPPATAATLAAQWRYFLRRANLWIATAAGGPDAADAPAAPALVVVLLAVGREIEWFGASARFAPSLASPSLQRLAQRRYRRGVGSGFAWPIALRPRLMQALRARGLAHLWVEEHGYVQPNLRGRRVAGLWQPVAACASAAAASVQGSAPPDQDAVAMATATANRKPQTANRPSDES